VTVLGVQQGHLGVIRGHVFGEDRSVPVQINCMYKKAHEKLV